MTHVTARLAAHHKQCDADFVSAEEAVRKADWAACAVAFDKFRRETEAHFGAEEDVLFPAFERSTGLSMGPTRMMRMEHMQMRSMFDQLASAQAAKDDDSFLGTAETLLIMLQQHNLKEENVLYPMCEQALAGDAAVSSAIERALAATMA